MQTSTPILTNQQWFRLSIKTRRRWWRETEYGELDPSTQLMQDVLKELQEEGNLDDRRRL